VEITKITLTKTDGENGRLAFGQVVLEDAFVVTGIAVFNSKAGKPFATMPRYKTGDGKWKDICFPKDGELRKSINQAVLKEYKKILKPAA